MAIKGTCPSCGTGGDISFFIADTDARKATMAAAKLPSDCGEWVIKYITMFSPPARFLTPGRYAKLITECCDMILNGVNFDRVHLTAPSHVWRQSMIMILEQQDLRRPIKNHHYLLRIVQSNLTKRADIDQHERATSRRNTEPARTQSPGMQKLGDIGWKTRGRGGLVEQAEEKQDPLFSLPTGEQKTWMVAAEKSLQTQGIRSAFITKNSIESEARALILEAES